MQVPQARPGTRYGCSAVLFCGSAAVTAWFELQFKLRFELQFRFKFKCRSSSCSGFMSGVSSRLLRVDQDEGDAAGLGAAVDPGMVGALLDQHVARLEVHLDVVEQHVDLA